MAERMPETSGAEQPARAGTPLPEHEPAVRRSMDPRLAKRVAAVAAVLLVAVVLAFLAWRGARPAGPGPGFVSGNGRIEAVEVDIATGQPGRIAEILVDEGDMVQAGQVVARMDLASLQAARAESVAREQQARDLVAGAEAQLAMRRSDVAAAGALVVQRRSELDAAMAARTGAAEYAMRGAP